MKFPKYDYSDMVKAEYTLADYGLGIKHLRRHRHFDGRHADLGNGRNVSELYGCGDSDGC